MVVQYTIVQFNKIELEFDGTSEKYDSKITNLRIIWSYKDSIDLETQYECDLSSISLDSSFWLLEALESALIPDATM